MSDATEIQDQSDAKRPRGIAPSLSLKPLSCSLTLSEGDGLADRLNMKLELRRSQSVSTPGGKELKNVDWFFEAYRGRSTHPELISAGAIGRLNYHGEKDCGDYSHGNEAIFWAHLPEAQFDLIRDLASKGRLPKTIIFSVDGLSYDWEPDGSGKLWDVDAQPNASIREVEFRFALVEQLEPEFAEDPAMEAPNLILARSVEQATRVTIPAQIGDLKQLVMWATAFLIGAVYLSR